MLAKKSLLLHSWNAIGPTKLYIWYIHCVYFFILGTNVSIFSVFGEVEVHTDPQVKCRSAQNVLHTERSKAATHTDCF